MPGYIIVAVNRKTQVGEPLIFVPDLKHAKECARRSWNTTHEARVFELGAPVFAVNCRGEEIPTPGRSSTTDLQAPGAQTTEMPKHSQRPLRGPR